MILLFIITSILYLIMMFFVITLYYTYRKDIEELEKRMLEIEKRLPTKFYKDIPQEELDELPERWENEYQHWITTIPENVEFVNLPKGKVGIKVNKKEGDNMACKGKKKK